MRLAAIALVATVLGVFLLKAVLDRQIVDGGPSPRSDTPATLIQIASALEMYRADAGEYPEREEGLSVLVGRYLPASALVDGWNRDVRYEVRGSESSLSYRLCSGGEDGAFSSDVGGDDICYEPE